MTDERRTRGAGDDQEQRATEAEEPRGQTMDLERDAQGRALLPDVPLLPGTGIRSALLTAFRFGSWRRAFDAYARAIEAAERAQSAITSMRQAEIEHARTLDKLNDIDSILEMDRNNRATERSRSKLDRLKAERELEDYEKGLHVDALRREADAEDQKTRIYQARRERAGRDEEADSPKRTLDKIEQLEKEMNERIRKIMKRKISDEDKQKEIEKVARIYENEINRMAAGRK